MQYRIKISTMQKIILLYTTIATMKKIVCRKSNKCHASVRNTKKVVLPKNFAVFRSSLYLFSHDIAEFQKFPNFLKICYNVSNEGF